MEGKLKKLVYVDPKDPSVEYEVIVRGAEKSVRALRDANGDIIHNTIDAGSKNERYNYILVNEPENARYDPVTPFKARKKNAIAVETISLSEPETNKIALEKTSDKPSLAVAVSPSPAVYKVKESSKPDEKVSLSSSGR